MFDTHSHPQFNTFDNDRGDVISRAFDNDTKIICVGTDYQSSVKAIELAEKYKGIWASAGLHPNDVKSEKETFVPSSGRGKGKSQKNFEELLKHPKVVAVGEVGLDYYRTPDPEDQERQREVLKEFIDLAIKYKKPLIIHCRDGSTPLTTSAHSDLISLLKTKNYKLKASAVIHSFTGTWSQAQKYLELGFYIGLNGIITFSDQYNQSVINAPLDRILLETDAPFLTPIPHRGTRNEPSYVKFVAERVARVKNLSIDEVERVTDMNAITLFKLK